MTRILYIAMSCGPNRGSEDAIGWNLPVAMSQRGNDVFVLTRSDKQDEIESYLSEHPAERGPEYLYEAQTALELKMNGPLLSAKVASWCRRVSKKLPSIVETYQIEVVHQITPLEYRSIIDVRELCGTKPRHVVTAIGSMGGAGVPGGNLSEELDGRSFFEAARAAANRMTLASKDYMQKLAAFDFRLFANEETKNALLECGASNYDEVVTDIGCWNKTVVNTERASKGHPIRILSIGRLIKIKGIRLLLEACSRLGDLDYELRIYGNGSERDALAERIEEFGLSSKVRLMGAIDHAEVNACYKWADFFVFPSVRDCSGAVLIESLSHGVPVMAFRQFGAANVITQKCGLLVDPEHGAEGFASSMASWIEKPSLIPSGVFATERARELTWEAKAARLEETYCKSICGTGLCTPRTEKQ